VNQGAHVDIVVLVLLYTLVDGDRRWLGEWTLGFKGFFHLCSKIQTTLLERISQYVF